MAKAAALVRGRDYVLPEDVSLVFGDVVPHRLLLSPRAEADRSFDPVSELLERVPAPGSPDAMAYRRIAYAALLGGAVLFQIVFRFYLSTFTLALVLLLPLLSVLLSLPSVLGCTLLLTSAAPTVVQGEDAVFQVRLRSRTRLPLPRLQARLHWSNQLTGAGGRVRWEPVRTAPGAPPTLELATPTAAG